MQGNTRPIMRSPFRSNRQASPGGCAIFVRRSTSGRHQSRDPGRAGGAGRAASGSRFPAPRRGQTRSDCRRGGIVRNRDFPVGQVSDLPGQAGGLSHGKRQHIRRIIPLAEFPIQPTQLCVRCDQTSRMRAPRPLPLPVASEMRAGPAERGRAWSTSKSRVLCWDDMGTQFRGISGPCASASEGGSEAAVAASTGGSVSRSASCRPVPVRSW